MLIDLSGRSFLVTGAGSGIGAACSRVLAESGAFVWVNDLRKEAADQTAGSLGGSAKPVGGDVSRPGEWLAPVREAGALHGIVHCAGFDVFSPVGGTEMREFDRVLAAMVTGPFDLVQQLLPNLTGAGGACVVFISSVHAVATEPSTSAYAAAKGAQLSMLRSLAQDLGPAKIRAVAVSPGYVDTPLLGKWFESTADPGATRTHADGLHPLGRIGLPNDIASLVAFLVSPRAEFINATNVVIDGGLTAMLIR